MSLNQIDKLFDKFYGSVHKAFTDQSSHRRYLTYTDKLRFEAARKKREEEQKKISQLKEFYCEICLEEKKSEDGIILSECYHIFCKDCIQTYIIGNTDGYLICPNDKCTIYLKDFQIKSLLSESDYHSIKLKCLKQIEAQLGKNAFHCKTVDCIGFCNILTEANVGPVLCRYKRLFQCPICTEVNCLDCNAIHRNKTCHEYQEALESSGVRAKNEKEREGLEDLVRAGEIMRCPKCSIFLQRNSGMCQYIRCFYCKMDICWLTRGPRWGPGGKGDTSGGCRCGVNGIRCHPDCSNCH